MGKVRYVPNQHALDRYYQTGSGGDLFFHGPAYQRGHGLGGLFGRLFRAAVPMLKSSVLPAVKAGTRNFAKEAIRTGLGVASDVLDGDNATASFERHGRGSAKRLLAQGARHLDGMLETRQPPRKRRKNIKRRRVDAIGRR